MNATTILQTPAPTIVAASPTPKPAHRILVVEDDEFIRQLTTQSLGLCGYQVTAAEDGLAGWHALNADAFDLMITDNNMPRLTGIGLLKKLRAARMGLPVIMATGVLPAEEFEKNPWLRPAATLLKPFTMSEYLETVHSVLHASAIDDGQFIMPPVPPPAYGQDTFNPPTPS
jgi:DNA-binding response OmpR family regulator